MEQTLSCPLLHGGTALAGGCRAVFLDRDGVLIPDTGYPDDPEAITLLPGVGEALRALRAAGWRLVVASNQSGVARGKFPPERLDRIHDRLRALLAAQGAWVDALYYCPHHPEAPLAAWRRDCDHRKPGPGMLRSAAERLGLEPDACWMVGDKESDVQAAHAAGCRAVRLGDGPTEAEIRAADLRAAADRILADQRPSRARSR